MSEQPHLQITSEREFEICRAKVRFPTKRSARTHINHLLHGHRTHGRPADLRTYCCPVCLGWHLTSKEASTKIVNRREAVLRLVTHRFEVRRRREYAAARWPAENLSPIERLYWAGST